MDSLWVIVGCCGLLYSFLIVVGSSGSFWVVYLILVAGSMV